MEADDNMDENRLSSRLIATLALLYFVQGIPQGIAFFALPTVLRSKGVPLEAIALLSMTSIFWAIKCLWASFVDNHWIARLGRRKSWIFAMQTLLAAAVLSLSLLSPSQDNVLSITLVLAIMSFAGATQDIATDGFASENSHASRLGLVNTIQMAGILSGILVAGPVSLLLFGVISYQATYLALAVLVLLALIPVSGFKEKDCFAESRKNASIKAFFKTPLAKSSLVFCSLVTVYGVTTVAIAKFFLIDSGWSVEQVGLLTGIAQLLAMLVGCLAAGRIIAKHNYRFTLNVGLIMVIIGGCLWIIITASTLNGDWFVYLTALIVGVGMGFIAVSTYSYIMRFSQQTEQPGTNIAIFQSTQTFGEIALSSLATAIAGIYGYSVVLVFAAMLAVGCLFALNKSRYFAHFNEAS